MPLSWNCQIIYRKYVLKHGADECLHWHEHVGIFACIWIFDYSYVIVHLISAFHTALNPLLSAF